MMKVIIIPQTRNEFNARTLTELNINMRHYGDRRKSDLRVGINKT